MKNLVPKRRFEEFKDSDPWEQRKLGEVINWSRGSNLAKSVINNKNIGADVIHYADLYKFSPVVDDVIHWSESDEGTIIPENSLLFPMSDVTPIGLARTSTITKSGVKAGGDTLIGTLNEYFNAEFMSYQINANARDILPLVTGTTVRHINSNSLDTLDILIANIEEQKRISNFFNRLGNLITLHQRKLDKLKETKSAYLSEMFPKEGELYPKRRFAGFTDPWEQRKLGEIADKAVDNRGKTPPLDSNGTHPLIEVASLGTGSPDYSKVEKFLNDYSFEHNLRDYIKKGDILFSTVGSIGLVSLMDDRENAAIAQNIVAFRAKENYSPEYLYALFSTESSKIKAYRIVMGAVQPSIKVSQLVDVKYFVTNNKEEQKLIGDFFIKLDNLITLHQRKLDKLQALKQAYLSEMFV